MCDYRDDQDHESNRHGNLDKQHIQKVLQVWQNSFPDAAILVQDKDLVTITFTDGEGHLLRINNVHSRSPLANNALYSAEYTEGHYINLFEIMLSDIPGRNGEISTAQYYINQLSKQGLNVSATHYHWTGSSMFQNDHLVAAIHHYQFDMDPIEFSKRTSKALKKALALIKERAKPYPSKHTSHLRGHRH